MSENNREEEKRKKLEIEFEDHKERNRRDLIIAQGKVTIDNMRAKEEIDEKLKKLDRQKDKETYEKEIQFQRVNHTQKMEQIKNKQENERIRANNETMEIKRKLDIELENSKAKNKREMFEVEGKVKNELMKTEGNLRIKTLEA